MTTSPNFGGHADRYRRFRPGYPDAPFDRAVEVCGQPLRRAFDLGAGSGQATAQVLRRFHQVVAVEPDAEMAALIPPDPRLSVQVVKAEDADFGEGVDAAFSATAFHWMDADLVCARVAKALRPRGVFLAMAYRAFEIRTPDAAAAALAEEARKWLPFMDKRLSSWRPYPDLMTHARAFAMVEPLEFAFEETQTAEQAAGLWLTTSFATAYARSLGDEEGYLAMVTDKLAEAAAGAPIVMRFAMNGALGQV